MKKVIHSSKAPKAIGPYSQAIDTGVLIFTSGQMPLNPQTGEMYKEIKQATRQVLENIKAILEEANTTIENVVKCTVYLKDLDDFDKMNEVYGQYFGKALPARTTVEAAKLPKDVVIEIDAIAVKV